MNEFPLPFYLVCIALLYFGWDGFKARREAWGLPAVAVLATVAAWYVGDALYNDYAEYSGTIGASSFWNAWWQVLLFVIAFGLMVRPIHRSLNRRLSRRGSFAFHAYKTNELDRGRIQNQISRMTWGIAAAWSILMVIAISRVDGNVIGLLAPYFGGEKPNPWARGRIGGGLDGLLSLAGYLQVFLTAASGVVFALSRKPGTRVLAGSIFFLAAPYFIFDRTRNTMLAAVIPGVLAWIVLRVKAPLVIKGGLLAGAFLIVNFWLAFVITNRGESGIAQAFAERSLRSNTQAKHQGLNMMEELGWINSFIETGAYQPNWGLRYLGELVNPIPRVIWKDKPTIGVDYAMARGMGWNQAGDEQGGIAASISTGMIGQGVANFGRLFGPVAAALIMSLWVALLARQDLLGWQDSARLLLYATGMILTFNMGRDITLLVLYPFVFGVLLLWLYHFYQYSFHGLDESGVSLKVRKPRRKINAKRKIVIGIDSKHLKESDT